MKKYKQSGNNTLLTLNQKTSKKVLISNVVLLKGVINYTIFYMENGKEKLVARPIKFFENYLKTHGFLRVHRSFLINPNHIKNFDKEQFLITMTNGAKANISRRRKHTADFLPHN
jgi:DNA-binding LytR/AlgR family response regulator